MKKLALCFIAFLGIFGSSAFADDRLYRFSQSDMDMIFHRDSAPLELAMLSPHEMQTTEGEWLPFVGAIVGGAMYGIRNFAYQIKRNQPWNWSSFAGAVGRGAYQGWRMTTPMGVAATVLNTPVMMGGQMIRASIMNRVGRYRCR